MSTDYIQFIPVDPRFVPAPRAQEAALAVLMAATPEARDWSAEAEDGIVFRDCGGNFIGVACPRCSAPIATAIWKEWMSADYAGVAGFRLDPVTMPCCGGTATLNDLAYDWPQGLSRFILTATNPDIGEILPPGLVPRLEALLGCRLRVIRRHL